MQNIAIDFGACNCVVTIKERGKPKIVPIDGSMITPSVIWMNQDGEFIVGRRAKAHVLVDSEHILISTKRDLGSAKTYQIGDESFTSIDAATIIFAYLKCEVSKELNEEISGAVITIPDCFGEDEKNAIKNAASNIGWADVEIISDSLAVACRYFIDIHKRSQIVVFIDIGGLFTNISVVHYDIIWNGRKKINTLAKETLLIGGDDFDNAIVRYMIDEGASGYKSELELKEEAEKAKIALSTSDVASISCEFVDTTLSRDKYKELISPYLDEICDTIKKTVSGAGKTLDDIGRFIMVGGSCKHPVIRQQIRYCVEREPYTATNLDCFVAEGAAYLLP